MSTDNILAAVGGGLEGVRDVLVPFFQMRTKAVIDQELEKQKFDRQKSLVPYELGLKEDSEKRMTQFKQPFELEKLRTRIPQGYYLDESNVLQKLPEGSKLQGMDNPMGLHDKSKMDPNLGILTREAADNLPKLKTLASSQKTNIETINKAMKMIDKGVTGKGGQLKSFLAPYAEFAGIDTESMNDAQTFQLLTRVIVGPMRLDIVGPGPVSEWEQKLMQQISGGGGTAKQASKELLGTYKRLAKNKIVDYNTTLEGAATLDKRFNDLYKPINADELDNEQADVSAGIHLVDSKKAQRLQELRLKKQQGTLK